MYASIKSKQDKPAPPAPTEAHTVREARESTMHHRGPLGKHIFTFLAALKQAQGEVERLRVEREDYRQRAHEYSDKADRADGDADALRADLGKAKMENTRLVEEIARVCERSAKQNEQQVSLAETNFAQAERIAKLEAILRKWDLID